MRRLKNLLTKGFCYFKSKQKWLIFVFLLFIFLTLSSLTMAKVYWLPDYQRFYTERTNKVNWFPFIPKQETCEDVGLYSEEKRPLIMNCSYSTTKNKKKCYACSCPSGYHQAESINGSLRWLNCDTKSHPQNYNNNSSLPQICQTCVTNTCAFFGYESMLDIYKNCTVANPSITKGLTCYSCKNCDSRFKYDSSNCVSPNILGGGFCGMKYETCTCQKNPCSGYDLSSCPAHSICDTCVPGCGDETVYYKRTGCAKDPCSGYNLNLCPAGSTCDTCVPGCGDETVYYKRTGCAKSFPEGYTANPKCSEPGQTLKSHESCNETRYKCVCEKLEHSCPPGSDLLNICTDAKGEKAGDCVDCRDPESANNPCKGFALCEGNKIPNGKSCQCGGLTYYERCLVPETCTSETPYDDTPLGRCNFAHPEKDNWWWKNNGFYPVGVKCTQNNGTKLYCHDNCNSSKKDLAGNDAPCKGKRQCEGDIGTGLCECGGKKYFDSCDETCTSDTPYDDTPLGKCNFAYPLNNSYWWKNNGYYPVGVKCTQNNGTKLYCTDNCNSSKKDLAGNDAPCKGKRQCEGDLGTGLCECGGKKYFDSCDETCTSDTPYDDTPLGKCNFAYPLDERYWWENWGYYPAGVKCTQNNGTKLYCHGDCNSSKKDLAGNDAPCKGKQKCEAGLFALGNTCSCGGANYGDSCGATCNFEETPETCSLKGKTFSQKCSDSSGNLFGECL